MDDSLVIVPQWGIVFLIAYLLESDFRQRNKFRTSVAMLHFDDSRTGIALIFDDDISSAASAFSIRRDRVTRAYKDARQYGVIEIFLVIVIADGVQQDT